MQQDGALSQPHRTVMPAAGGAGLRHRRARPGGGDAARRVLPQAGFESAIAEISAWEGYAATPLRRLGSLAAALGLGRLYYKDESSRFGLGSFKALGGAYAAQRVVQRVLSDRLGHSVTATEVRKGVHRDQAAAITLVSATDGNHGRALAWGARRFGARCRIFIHAEVSEGRAQAMRDLGAEVERIDGDYDASVRMAAAAAAANGWHVVSDTAWEGYTEPPRDVMSGYGVMCAEICAALSRPPTHVLVQGGVGGMAAAVAAYFRHRWQRQAPRLVVVEPEDAACLFASAAAGQATAVPIARETVMAGLSCGEPSPLAWPILAGEASDFLTVPDAGVGPAMKRLANPLPGDPRIEAGESAVAGLVALMLAAERPELRDALGLSEMSRVLLIGSEGITDRAIWERMTA